MTDPLGQSQVIPYLAGLSRFGYEFTILSCEKPKNYSLRKKEIQKILNSSGIKWVPIPYHKKPAIFSTIYDVIALNKKAKQLHAKTHFDLVHTRPGIPALIGLEMKKKFGVKFLNDIREFYADSRIDGGIWNLENVFYKKIYTFFKQKEKEEVANSDGIVCLTSAAENIIKSWPEYKKPLPLKVIPCSVDLNLFDPVKIDDDSKKALRTDLNIKDDEFIISYLGSIGSWYLIEEMMQFFKIISDNNSKTKFLFITPDSKKSITSFANKFGLDLNKLIIKEAKRDEVPALLSLSKFSVFFIKPCYSKQSSSPTKHGEIMAMGIPVITNSGVGDVAEIVTKYNAGIVLEDLEVEEFKKTAKIISDNSFFDKSLARKGALEVYNLNSAIKKYKTIYDGICKFPNSKPTNNEDLYPGDIIMSENRLKLPV